ncbi:hypothetical protein B0H17DRAFT_1179958 [Mycena rosella]|uniref:Uncharacterized protein n=1 Tax=Mycena rosella TaxID=1033263 RepID=A0AAD7DF59_MYCRO|nr:hypothetical protein B0H17DRAFT_1179958 [Mycena rosella]
MEPASTPILPPELERHIFEICALARPVAIPKLMLVAWRVMEWVEPMLYRTIVIKPALLPAGDAYPMFTSRLLTSAVNRKPANFFRYAVRHLFLFDYCEDDLAEILSACTGVENLWMGEDIDQSVLPLLAPLRLKHLCIDIRPLFHAFPPHHSFFSQLTHLELLDDETDDASRNLPLIPHLTHLSFNDFSYIPISLRILETCPSLAVLVALNSDSLRHSYAAYAGGLSKDVRFVAMNCEYYIADWLLGTKTGQDYWHRAEVFIAQRRSGEVDALRFEIVEDGSKDGR